jgi:hypothetical protein
LAELRGEFIKYDTNKDGTIPASNVATICETLGETLNNSALQLLLTEMKKDIAERVEWVNFLNALVSKREAARRNGVGLLEKFGLKKAAAEKKKALAAGTTEKDQAPIITDEMYYWGDKEVGHTVPGTDENCQKTTFVSTCNKNCCSKCRHQCDYCELGWCPDCASSQPGFGYDYNRGMREQLKYCDNCVDSYRYH